ncbi:MAG: hypothetical protein HYV60_09820 [Planctomycetia bacterium]|nr:hypothetical protein [Planctomycetia bacterium]
MKAVFTCDDVFDILTRQPFPSGGAEDEFVESHLGVCHECRQLAEAFRPAVGLFHESMSAEIDDELPTYRGRLKPIIDSLPRPRRATVTPARNAFTMTALVIAASVVLVGSTICATLAVNQQSSEINTVAADLQPIQNRDFMLLAALEIPAACRPMTKTTNLAAADDIACCTNCHKAGSRIVSTEKAVLKSSAACVACHDGMLSEALSAARPWRGAAIAYDRMQAHFRKSFQAEASAPLQRLAWRSDSIPVKPGYLPMVTCQAARRC